MPSAWIAQYTASDAPTAGRRSPRSSTLIARRGLVAHAVDADVHRADEAHPVLVLGEAPGQVRAAGDHEDDEQGRHRDERRSPIAIHAWSTSSSDGSIAKPSSVRSGSATKPVSRSMTTDANAMSPVPVVFEARLMRRTSPPIVDGSTLPTNWPAR